MSEAREAQPRRPGRSPADHIRRANIADAASGFDGFPAVEWVRECGANVSETLRTWQNGQLAELPVGRAWNVVRVPSQEGWEVVRHMSAVASPLGPVLLTPDGVHFFVPVDSANDWDLPGASVLGPNEVLLVPHPSVVAPHTQDSMTWIVAPRPEPRLADAADLYGAYASAIAITGTSRGDR
ncbi:hypothetical protein ACFVTT_15530 [Streptomyces niveus]|uniref:hypothetical protein n=1 Tax=Streptomyces niveus TaxID=193462 RepID=UPI00343FE935